MAFICLVGKSNHSADFAYEHYDDDLLLRNYAIIKFAHYVCTHSHLTWIQCSWYSFSNKGLLFVNMMEKRLHSYLI